MLAVCWLIFAGPASSASPEPGDIQRLIRQLGSPRYKERHAAAQRLRTMGEPALVALHRAEQSSPDPEIRLHAGQLVQALAHPLGIGGRVLPQDGAAASLAFSPDGRWLVTAGASGTPRLWDLRSADPSTTYIELRGHCGPIRGQETAFSPDGRWLVTAAADWTARLWDLKTAGTSVKSFVLPGYYSPWGNRLLALRSLTISSNSRWLVTQGPNLTARMWDLTAPDPSAKWVEFRNIASPKGQQGSLITSPNGRWLALRSSDLKSVRVVDLEATDPQASTILVRVRKGKIARVWAITANGRWLGVVHADNKDEKDQLWDLRAKDPAANTIMVPDFG
jgi:WD40 repeat protein